MVADLAWSVRTRVWLVVVVVVVMMEMVARFVKHQTFVMNNIYDLDAAPIIQIHGLFMIILSNI